MSEELGNFTLHEIANFVQEVKVPEDAGSSPTDRFVKQISELVTVRAKVGEVEGISVILKSDALDSDVRDRDYKSFPLFRNGIDPISQGIFVSNALLVQAYAIQLNTENKSIFDEVRNAGFGRFPALVIDWRGSEPRATLFASGIENQDDLQEVFLFESDISATHLKQGLDDFYNKRLRTPLLTVQGHSIKIWDKASEGLPAFKPEERIEGVLMTFLTARYSRFEVRAEIPTEDGRLDIKILAKLKDHLGTKIVNNIWVLELKALTDRTSTGNFVPSSATKEAIRKGLIQACSYKDAEHVNNAALCCFDMRTNDAGDEQTFSDIQSEAANNEIHLWRWFLHRSSDAGRSEKFFAKATSQATS